MTATRVATLALLMTASAACHTWRAEPPSSGAAREMKGRVRVTRTDGTRFDMRNAVVAVDSVIGMTRRSGRQAVPRDSVARVERRVVDRGRTIRNTGWVLALYFGMAYIISGSEALPH